ncbi:hypothetical protein ACWD5B_02215 [Streptomyces tanashiensis]|uniref:hypothetical protein n=1 Tax=Streptomyces tanashiensis TaxID=67367 RepID=UPI0036B6343A
MAVWFDIDGRLGAKLKEIVCVGVVKHLADEAEKPGGYRLHRVSGGAARQRQLQAKQTERAEQVEVPGQAGETAQPETPAAQRAAA